MTTPEKEFSIPHSRNLSNRYLQFAGSLILLYKGVEPFHLYLKKYFSANKKHGSKDRKQITSLCYNYFRLGRGVSAQLTIQDKFLLGTFLCESSPSPILIETKARWNENIKYELKDKLKIVEDLFDPKNNFPFQAELSDKIDLAQFCNSFLQQPKLFIRIRPGKETVVYDKLKSANLSFEKINNYCLMFSHNEKVTDVISADKEAVIQDYNSQRVFDFFKSNTTIIHINVQDDKVKSPLNVWDCCAGSGGKSILAADVLKNIKLTVTDKRESILQNLHQRFASAGIKNYDSLVVDLTDSKFKLLQKEQFNFVIADIPCSGSGTWSRTPEQLTFFHEKEIEKYAVLQKKIIENVLPHLYDGGILLYITCSVFKKENEDIVEYILQKFQLNLLNMEYLKGYEMQADILFVAAFRKPSLPSKGGF